MARALLAPTALCALILLVYWKLTLVPGQYVWFDHYDLCQLQLPRLQFLARELHNGHFPLWNPHSWAGLPVLGSSQPGPAYPLNLLVLALPLRDGAVTTAAWNLWFLATHALASSFCYLLLRDLGLRVSASLLGGIAFSTLGFLGGVPWIDVANGVVWTPLLFLFFLRIRAGVDRMRNAALLGVALGLCWLSGHHEIPLLNSYALLFAAAAEAVAGLARRRSVDRGFLGSVALAFLLAASISAVQTLPVYEFGRHAIRWVGAPEGVSWQDKVPYEVHASYSLTWLELRSPGAYIGWSVAALAILAAFRRASFSHVAFFGVLGIAALIFALGSNTPVHRVLYELLPMLDKARTPVRAMFLVSFALSVLAALGAQWLIERSATRGLAVAAALLTLVTLEAMVQSDRRVTPAGKTVCASALVEHRPLVETLLRQPSLGRVTVNRDEWLTHPGELYGFDQHQGFVAGVPANVLRHESHTERTQQLFGVSHHLGKTPGHPGDELIATDSSGMKLYRKQTPLPRAWVVHTVIPVANDGELRKAIQDPSVDLARAAPMLGEVPRLETCADEEAVGVSRPDTDNVRLEARLACRGIVVLSDTVYPGWEALLDGQPAPIVEVYGSLRGVVADRGAHTIEMRYRPWTVRIGGLLSVAGLALAVVLMRTPRRRDATRPVLL